MIKQTDPIEFFKLRTIKAAKVSEVSEAAASSNVSPEERVNFHIGNPAQDIRLSSAFLRMALGIDIKKETIFDTDLDKIIEELQLSKSELQKIEFIKSLIKVAAPYMPRGGFNKQNPNFLVKYFIDWLTKEQQEPLSYDLGEKSGRREIILSSGGLEEGLRLFLQSIDSFLLNKPADIFLYHCKLPKHLTEHKNLNFISLDEDEKELLATINTSFLKDKKRPSFLILGKHTKEETRRALREISINNPIFFVEINDAPNHLSLAREAKMENKVLRFLTPGIFSAKLKDLATVFIAGNADFLKVIENMQFQLKGTPSSTEVELLSYILKNKLYKLDKKEANSIIVNPANENSTFPVLKNNSVRYYSEKLGSKLEKIIDSKAELVDNILQKVTEIETSLAEKSETLNSFFAFDKFAETNSLLLLDTLIHKIDSPKFFNDLSNSFLFSFVKHHPEYKISNCSIVSGSSRTALGIIGFNCGITEVVFPDLSWTYEHCFPKVNVVPLTEDFQLDVDAIINCVSDKLKEPTGFKHGAVAINNPHNATGKAFNELELKRLLTWLLQNNVFVIDDLSYQNVAPSKNLTQIKTLKQITNELVLEGYVTEENAKKVISVHSLSKTDSYAGARLTVAEINDPELFTKFKLVNSTIKLNIGAIFLAYTLYRNKTEDLNAYWQLRNLIFYNRMSALTEAVESLPKDRNKFDIKIIPPVASMYPQMVIDKLPAGLSLDWLASGLARQGIGLIPLSTFARTEKGYETGRKSFRLTYGGTDNEDVLLAKTRRVLIDLNRMIAEEASNYNKKQFDVRNINISKSFNKEKYIKRWTNIEITIKNECKKLIDKSLNNFDKNNKNFEYITKFNNEFINERLAIFKQRYFDRLIIMLELIEKAKQDKGKSLIKSLNYEFYKDNLNRRETAFKTRLYDRTVHPTQMYSLKVELLFEKLIESLLKNRTTKVDFSTKLAKELINEFFGLNVAIVSSSEPDELLLDLDSLIAAENFTNLHSDFNTTTFLSFWGDWDGSSRPSGQGHSLVAAVLIENVLRQADFLKVLLKADSSIKIDTEIIDEIDKLPETTKKFSKILKDITILTHQLEKRIRGILPYNLKPGALRKIGMKLHIAQDPITSLWKHNDRLESKMLGLRKQRKDTLEYYFSFNKTLRKTLALLIPTIEKNINNELVLYEACLYKDLLKRFIITPRIHQKMITAQDQFAIDTTVHNINEINQISGKYGNPGMVMALQISMSSKAEALILLDRKIHARREQSNRENKNLITPGIWLVPLFEDIDAVNGMSNYLNKVWEYSVQSRRLNQEISERFTEIISEVFVAGSDLSQQVGQTAGMNLYKTAKFNLTVWLSEKGLIGKVRMKMGCGEPMQRQGGYYSPVVGKPAFIKSDDSAKRFSNYLKESTKKSTEYAATPLIGIFNGGDLRTYQSSISEKLRHIKTEELAQLLFHVKESQRFYETEVVRAGEPLNETRLQFKTRGLKELERLTIGRKDELFDKFVLIFTENFRQILYGKDEDILGIHIISYFIARTSPALRDRPLIRPGQGVSGDVSQKILEKIAGTIPFSKYGSLLRAIAHNQAQTIVLGLNQLTTGMFRALDTFSQLHFPDGESNAIIEDRILPNLPVYEILHTLRVYQDIDLKFYSKVEKSFQAGNSALIALREDVDALKKYIILFQRELLRRHGLNVNDFFDGGKFNTDLLPTLRPDLAVLLQPDLFNTDMSKLTDGIIGNYDITWNNEVKQLLDVPVKITEWRTKIWDLLDKPVTSRVNSFVELAVALYSLAANTATKELPFSPKTKKLSSQITSVFKSSGDENMQQFLSAAFELLSVMSEEMIEVPINIIRALKEVERIIKIEEQALDTAQQDLLRFYLLQIARLTGENG